MSPRRQTTIELVCNGRAHDGRGALCGVTYTSIPGESQAIVEQRLRIRGWRLGPAGPDRHVMCPTCAKPLARI